MRRVLSAVIAVSFVLMQCQPDSTHDLGAFDRQMNLGGEPASGFEYDSAEQVYRFDPDGDQAGPVLLAGHFPGDGFLDLSPTWSGRPYGLLAWQSAEQWVGLIAYPGQSLRMVHAAGDSMAVLGQIPMEQKQLLGGMRLERRGDSLLGYVALPGDAMQAIGQLSGLPASDMSLGIVAEGEQTFANLRWSAPLVPDSGRVDRGRITSRLEILDFETGIRRIRYQADQHFEAPNWSRDGEYLLFNQEGKLYTIGVASGEPELLPTGFADACNNDHGFSPDGSQIVISHGYEAQPIAENSTIFVLPATGGEPQQITPNAPSYWHGWSPDGRTLAFVGRRNDQYDIYTIPADGSGKEVQLTDQPTLDDGPDYAPDGSWIYFNSARTGTMQIWKMRPDGSEQTQLTFDQYQDWFPHPSPDGEWLVFVSYPETVPFQAHPPNQRVMLRAMPADGSKEPRTITWLYGGQGTINVPSWSPDGRYFAFVSYSYRD